MGGVRAMGGPGPRGRAGRGRRTRGARWFATILLLAGVAAPAVGQAPDTAGEEGTRAAPFVLEPVRVEVGSRAGDRVAVLTRSVEVISSERLRALPVRSVAEALDWVSGVDVRARSFAQADLSIRGAGMEEVLVLVDGAPVDDAQTGHFHLDLSIPLDQVERIEVLRGPAAALYGADAVGGVVNVVTRAASPTRVRVTGGSFGLLEGSVAAAGGGAVAWAGGLEHSRSDGHRPGTDHEATLARARGSIGAGAGEVVLDLSHGRRDFGADGFYAPYDSFERTRTTLAILRWTGAPGVADGGSVDVRSWARRHFDDFILIRDDPGVYRNRHRSLQYGAAATVRALPVGPLTAGLSVEARRDELDSSNLGDRSQSQLGAAAELAGELGPTLATVGLRGDWYDAFGGRLSPSAAVAVGDLSDPVRVRAAWGGAFRIPSWTERYYEDPVNIGDPEIRPERSWSAELGLDLFPGAVAGGEVTVYRRWARDLIDWARPAGSGDAEPWRTRNVDAATFEGLEVELRGPPVAGVALALEGSWIAVDAETEGGFESKYALRPLTRSLGLRLRAPLSRAVSLTARAVNERRRGEDDRVVADAAVAWEPGPWGIRLHVTNLGDARYADIAGLPAPGRALSLTLERRLSSDPAAP